MSLADRRQFQEACTRCSQCKFVSTPSHADFASACPSIDYGHFNAYSGGGKVITSYALATGKAPVTPELIDTVYACTMCGACDTLCKTNQGDTVEPMDTLYALRAHLAKKGHAPRPQVDATQRLRKEGSHLGARAERSRWADGLQLKNATREPVEVLLHAGGSNAFDRTQWPQLHAIVKLLTRAGIHFGIAYDDETDAGGLAYDVGFQDITRELGVKYQQRLAASRASVLVSACASDYAAFRNLYPRLGITFKKVRVAHITEYLAELLACGRLPQPSTGTPTQTVTYHDPCRLGRLSEQYEPWEGKFITVHNTMLVPDSPKPVRFGTKGNYDAPRQLLTSAGGVKLVEMPRNREFAYCCGAGAATGEAYPELAQMAAVNRLREAQSTGAYCIVTACAGCQQHLASAAKANGIGIEVRGVIETIAGNLPG